jgi:hypothetical protein
MIFDTNVVASGPVQWISADEIDEESYTLVIKEKSSRRMVVNTCKQSSLNLGEDRRRVISRCTERE